MRREAKVIGAIGARADRRFAACVERLERGRSFVDPDDFADLDAIADVDGDVLAELEKARQTRETR